MALGEPPVSAGSLADLPRIGFAGRKLHRVWRHDLPDGTQRENPWWFGSVPDDPEKGGRFDLPAPMGTCYTATTPAAATLESLQAHLSNLPRAELEVRRRAEITTTGNRAEGADLTHPKAAGHGITAALWAGGDRPLTQRWAAALRRDGWWAVHGGIQHDPSGQLRGISLFDHNGAHPPTFTDASVLSITSIHDDGQLHDELAEYGVTVREPADLPYVIPETES